jgi:sugar phosphate isomerase/epimerase
MLLNETNPKYVQYEMDILWIVHPGQDPVALLNKYGNRFELMHVKDLKKGIKGDLSGGTDVKNDVTLGTGQIDLPAVLKAAQNAGVKWYFIEDESPTSEQQMPNSLQYLQGIKF